jgi:hypothetical protein
LTEKEMHYGYDRTTDLQPREASSSFFLTNTLPIAPCQQAARRRRRSPADGFELKELAWDLMNMGKDRQFPIHSLTDQS